jgi:hypothetical protein
MRTCLLQPEILCARSNPTITSSVSLFPRERIRDITSERFALEGTSAMLQSLEFSLCFPRFALEKTSGMFLTEFASIREIRVSPLSVFIRVHPWLKKKLCGSLRSRRLCVKASRRLVVVMLRQVLCGQKTFAWLASFAVFEDEDEHEDDFKPASRPSEICVNL